jgi:hypothetical protein
VRRTIFSKINELQSLPLSNFFSQNTFPFQKAKMSSKPSTETITDYESPLLAINQEIRRKNLAVAAAASTIPFSDPWEQNERVVLTEGTSVCVCPPRTPRRGPETEECPVCGKKMALAAWGTLKTRLRSPSISYSSSRTDPNLEPQHAQALLEATPQLRILSPASVDFGSSPPRILPFFSETSSPEATAVNSWLDYKASLVRERANHSAAAELASLLWVLAHEMSLEEYGTVESEVFSAVFGLVHADQEKRMAGLAAVDALLEAPSADEEKKAIKFANTLSTSLRKHGDYEFLSAVSKALGHMATTTANVDFVESEVTRALEWLRTDRSDRR